LVVIVGVLVGAELDGVAGRFLARGHHVCETAQKTGLARE
jgi:hypothetical protein